MSGVDDDLKALERRQMPKSSLIAEVWAEDTLRVMRRTAGIITEWEREWQDELRWLKASLEADALPDWCIQMVMDGWRTRQINTRYPAHYRVQGLIST
ncbi:MAG TPA: hypothetical protein VJO13_09085 [Ktedonobacterales bacterium]|nr:hypothetical protein [Ktedonobacterales bacterium]